MERPDDAIDRVLAGLREVEAPAGMERRILERAAARVHARRGRLAWVAGCAGLAAAALVLGIWVMPRAEIVADKQMVAIGAEPDTRVLSGVQAQDDVPPGRTRDEVQRHEERSGERAVAHAKLPAALETGGIPAPPLPLTEQEKLLLRIVRRGEQDEVPTLNAEVRASREAASDAEFQEFFKPTPLSNGVEDESTNNKKEQGETR